MICLADSTQCGTIECGQAGRLRAKRT